MSGSIGMLVKTGLVLSFVLASTMSVWAQSQSCGNTPFPPAIPSAADLAAKSPTDAHGMVHDSFLDVKNWQSDLKNYRACLDGQDAVDKRDISQADPKKDADKIKAMQDQIALDVKIYDASVDNEEKVVNEFHALQAGYCMRTDIDKSTCPK
jgi:hypothetical protein